MKARQQGVALLTAIILVAVAAIVATAIAWQSELSSRRSIAVFTVAQSLALAEGAEAMAAYALQSNQSSNHTTVGLMQDWAKPYGPVEIDNGAVLEASLEDQSGKFNLNSLVMQAPAGVPGAPGSGGGNLGISPPALAAVALVENPSAEALFEALLASLNIDTKYAARLVDWIDTDDNPRFPDGAEDSFYLALTPPHRTPNMPVTSVSELLAMGMDRASYDKLVPFVAALPPDTALNICTAAGVVLDAISGQHSYALDPAQLAQQRQQFDCFPSKTVFVNGLSGLSADQRNYVSKLVGTTSSYFRLRTWITIGTTRFTLYSLLEARGSGQIRPIFRTFGTD